MKSVFDESALAPLSAEITAVFAAFTLPPRLRAHLLLVHDTAAKLLNDLCHEWGSLAIDRDAVLFGAATHDIGKCVYVNELIGEGHGHEAAGKEMLLKLGIAEDLAKFAASHASWSRASATEELFVSLADKIWKGNHVESLENLVVEWIAEKASIEKWEAFSKLDAILQWIANDADARLAWQNQFSVN